MRILNVIYKSKRAKLVLLLEIVIYKSDLLFKPLLLCDTDIQYNSRQTFMQMQMKFLWTYERLGKR
jgi:hypothetical protein